MSKTGILTYHNNENKGAILQALCLTKALSHLFNEEVEVIEYRTASKERKRKIKTIITKKPSQIPRRIKDRQCCESFIREEFNISDDSIITDDHEEATEWLESQEYNILVTGSDEVWKINNRQTSWRSKLSPKRPFPNLYHLDPRLSAAKVAYAASANTVEFKELNKSQRELFKEHLTAYDHISVRDNHTERMLEHLGIDNVSRVPDPTIMWEIPTRDVRSVLEQNGIDTDEKILGFHGPNNDLFEAICHEYRQRGYQIVAINGSQYADLDLRGAVDPFEYYSLYAHFDMVVTSSLHSTIFSLKNHTPFVTIDTSTAYKNIESKTQSLLSDFTLLDRHIDATDSDAISFFDNIEDYHQPLDEKHIMERINKLQKQGYKFLNTVKENYETSY
ncbi:polysaccharide pyruvyl transferase family protein [Natrialbaceae archaeon A-CW2]